MAELALRRDLEALTVELREAVEVLREAATSTLVAAIRVGEILMVLRDEVVPLGQWHKWLEENTDLTPGFASDCMRLSVYRDHVIGRAADKTEAIKMLRGMPALYGVSVGGHRRYPQWVRDEAKKLREEGKTLNEISAELGVHEDTVWSWIDPDYRARKRREKAELREARDALKRERKRQAARKIGSAIAESYSHVRLLAEALDAAIAETDDEKIKRSLRAARLDLIEMEGHIETVLRLA